MNAHSEAVRLYRTLADDRPIDFTRDLAASLFKLGDNLFELGRHDGSLDAHSEAVKLY